MKKYPAWLKANVPEDLRKRYEKAAEKDDRTLEAYVRIALTEYADQNKL